MTAPAAPQIIEKGIAGDSLVVETVIAKYADYTPLYRQSAMLQWDAGVEVSRVTMDGWVMRVGELPEPITQAMRREIVAKSYLQADGTPVDVQRRPEKKGKNRQAYLWQFGNPRRSVVFSFSLRRAAELGRQERAKPLLDAMEKWLSEQLGRFSTKSPAAKAIHYSLELWPVLVRYCGDRRIEIDNNAAERALRAVAITHPCCPCRAGS